MSCSFSWEKLKEMKDNQTEFLAGDGFDRVRIIEIDEKKKSLYMICQKGKITWPLKYKKIEEIHEKVHKGEIDLVPFVIDRLAPTWGSYITGLLKFLGCP